MSLHTLAHHLQSAGRGDDKVLVHMTPGEVKGLQALAMAHGGSLTINPETGLPEAGILSAILPMVAGFFLGPAGLGMTAMQSALTVGALGTAATGSLGKGFMMGLGAYGGAGMGEGLASAGQAATPVGSNYGSWMATDAGKLAAEQAATSAKDIAAANAVGPNVADVATNALQPLSPASPFANTAVNASSYTQQFAPNGSMAGLTAPPVATPALDASTMIPKPTDVFTGGAPSDLQAASMRQTALDKATADSIAAQQKAGITSATPSTWDNVGTGFKKATGSWEGAKQVWDATPKGTGYGLAATGMGVLQAQQEEAAKDAAAANAAAAAERRGYIRPYDYSTEQVAGAYAPSASTAERGYFVEPRFTARDIYKVKEGGLMSLAVGGQVEQMSAANAMGSNTGYPMANLQTPMYANPMMSRPVPTNVISPSGDTGVDTYSGEMRMASGGAASANAPAPDVKYSYDPNTMQYTQTTTATPAANNLMGNPLVSGLFGLAPYMRTMGGGYAGGQGMLPPMYQKLFGQQAAPQPAVTTETSGGTATPYMPTGIAAASNMPMVPNIQLRQPQSPEQQLGLESFYPMMEQSLAMRGAKMKEQGYAEGGTANGGYSLGSYSDGGRLLRGPGDGVSDSIPASIGDHQPARLADGEFVVPARIVSEIGNGSTEAGARKLYAMMDRVQKARRKTVGKDKVAVNTKADKLLPA